VRKKRKEKESGVKRHKERERKNEHSSVGVQTFKHFCVAKTNPFVRIFLSLQS
jgi:hypothetical protein